MAADLTITEFTDPGCPFGFSAEPSRLRLSWLYGERLDWRVRMVGLSASPQEALDKGFTPEVQSGAFAKIATDHGMPIDTRQRPRMAATLPACRAVVAARLHAPRQMRALLRALRVRHFGGELLDAAETIDGAATDAGIDPAALAQWTAGDDVQSALDEDLAAAREPSPAARVLDDRLTDWPGGRRYTCPSYELVRAGDGVQVSVPGFQPFVVYDVATANLLPGVERRPEPESVAEVLEWAGTPLATKEVAVVCGISVDQARERLGRVAVERPVGDDGYWALRD
jgi:predicted DsbA family dithiol-disulfide isomerase